MQVLSSISRLSQRLRGVQRIDEAHTTTSRLRICRFEQFEPRELMTANAPSIIVGGTEYEQAAGNDRQPNIFVVTFQGGAAGTQLTHLEINGSKSGGALTFNDAIFDTAPGGLGAYASHPLQIVSHDGFQVLSATASDGSTLLSMDFSGFTAGMTLVFSVDVDQVIFVDPQTGQVSVDAVDEGAEFERSHLTTTFDAPHYAQATVNTQYWDVFGANVAAAEQQAGNTLALPDDAYTNSVAANSLAAAHSPNADVPNQQDVSSMTTGAVGVIPQVPLPITLAGTVYDDHNLNNHQDTGDEGLAGVALDLQILSGSQYVDTGLTTTTDASGNYKFTGLLPGTYEVVKTPPAGYFNVGASAGNVGGTTVGTVESANVIDAIALLGGDDSVQNNFAEAVPNTLSGYVRLDPDANCGDNTDVKPLAGVTVELLNSANQILQTTTTDSTGLYKFTGLLNGTYTVHELPPVGYIHECDHPGTAGGQVISPGVIGGVVLVSSQNATNYNYYEMPPGSISGRVHKDVDGHCDTNPNEPGLAGVTVQLLDGSGNVLKTTVTDSNGDYVFQGLPPGTYAVHDIQPVGYRAEDSKAGSIGGQSVDVNTIGSIVLHAGINAVDYNFCEEPPGSLSGSVHIDVAANGLNDTSDSPLAGVTVELLDVNNNVLQTTQTDANGHYTFTQVYSGNYSLRELPTNGYYFEDAFAGSVGGTAADSHDITQISLPVNTNAVNYNFYVVPPGSISGRVHKDIDGHCDTNPNEPGLAGVTVQLLDGSGNVLKTTVTDSGGAYNFQGLSPGTYTVHEIQPVGYRAEDSNPGSVGGQAVNANTIGSIVLHAGINAVNYNFCEEPPGSLSGSVHIDVAANGLNDTSDPPLAGVTVELLDANNNVLQTTQTDSSGHYTFTQIYSGNYSLRELPTAGYYFEDAFAGSVGGAAADSHDIAAISLPVNTNAVNYNFYVVPPGSISGRVHKDVDGHCDTNPSEPGLAGVTVQLLNRDGTVLQTTVTDASGDYSFAGVMPGTYTVHEIQPAGYFAEDSDPGSIGGKSVDANTIGSIVLAGGVNAVNYNFCEMLPASLTGKVMVSTTPDCAGQWTLPGVAGVTVNLIDSHGTVVATTTTDALGNYAFSGLVPGVYTVQDIEPASYFANTAAAGDAGGSVVNAHNITGVTLGSGVSAMCYDFYVTPPATVAGTVFQDGPAIQLGPGQQLDVPAVRDGILTPDDARIAGVTLELRDGATGAPILGSQALPGYYGAGPITTVTDASGNYTFGGLKAGNYAVFEIQPGGTIDGITRAGTTGGVVIGPYTATDAAVLAGLQVGVPHDAILRISVSAGEVSSSNNFSIVATDRFFLFPNSLPLPNPALLAQPYVPQSLQPQVNTPLFIMPGNPVYYSGSSPILNNTWHLSVVNAGQPRGPGAPEPLVRLTAAQVEELAWEAGDLDDREWTLAENAGAKAPRRRVRFGMKDGFPITGDFNGDGITDLGVFKHGQWFIDVNGNGVWDEGDLWAKLGHEGDKPVTGDWDGDGKTDIGIFGRAWPGDPRAVQREPGLPDSHNMHTNVQKNLPPPPQGAAHGVRALKLTSQGHLRSDLIDHVFFYGTPKELPLVGDWNGDGTDTIAVFRDGWWYRDVDGDGKRTDADSVTKFGQSGDIPIVGDFDGDGIDEIAVYRNGTWYIDTNNNGTLDATDQVLKMGGPGDVPVVGDWDGDGRQEPGLFHDRGLQSARR